MVDEPAAPSAVEDRLYVVAIDDVYRAEYAGLVRLAFALTGRLDVAEELVQDAFEQAHRQWSRVAAYDRPGAWLRRVVLTRCIGRHRRLGTEAKLLLRLGAARDAHVDPTSFLDRDLLAAIRALPTRQAQVVALVCLDDRPVDEVAELLGCSADTVRTHLRRGRLALAARLGLDHGGDA